MAEKIRPTPENGDYKSTLPVEKVAEIEKDTQSQEDEVERLFGNAEQAMREALQEAKMEGLKDSLTGLDNLGAYQEKAKLLIGQLNRGQIRCITMLMIDMDHLRTINNTLGHPAGNIAIKGLADELKRLVLRSTDVVARWGGEEFVILFADATPEEIMKKLQEIYKRDSGDPDDVAHLRVKVDIVGGESMPLTVSGGITAYSKDPNETLEQAEKRADKALYRCKEEGRDRIKIYDEETMADVVLEKKVENPT